MLLSLGLPALARARGIATLMTLHDFWLYCARFGQLLEHGETVCRGPKPRRCADCMTDFKFRQTPLEKKVISAIRWTKDVAGFDLAPVVDTLRDTAGTTTRLLKMGRKKARADGAAPRAPRGDRREEMFKAREAAVAEMLPHIDAFLAPSRTVLDRMVSFGLPARRIRHVPLGVDTEIVARDGPRGGAPVFGFIGTLAPHKGVHVAIAAMRYLKGHGRLLVFGRGDYYPRYASSLQTMAQRLPVEFKGAVPRQEIGRAFAQIDVLVMPSVWLENFPIVIQEARAARVPVIASDIGGMREAVRDGEDGLLFRAGDAGALARKMAMLLRDPQRIETMAAAAVAPATLEEHVDAIEERLARAVEARRDRARP
jgi:glycosyltransferase involved in cell wall biosynthesis